MTFWVNEPLKDILTGSHSNSALVQAKPEDKTDASSAEIGRSLILNPFYSS